MNTEIETFRIETARLKEWDYTTPWCYYVTINTKQHIEYFGSVVNEKMVLNELGNTVEKELLKARTIRKNVDLDCFVVMPNHFHGIIILTKTTDDVETCRGKSLL